MDGCYRLPAGNVTLTIFVSPLVENPGAWLGHKWARMGVRKSGAPYRAPPDSPGVPLPQVRSLSGRPDSRGIQHGLPGADIGAARAIRAAEPPGTRLPSIALTAKAFDEDRDACLAAGMDGCLGKPIQRQALLAAIDQALAGSAAPPLT